MNKFHDNHFMLFLGGKKKRIPFSAQFKTSFIYYELQSIWRENDTEWGGFETAPAIFLLLVIGYVYRIN